MPYVEASRTQSDSSVPPSDLKPGAVPSSQTKAAGIGPDPVGALIWGQQWSGPTIAYSDPDAPGDYHAGYAADADRDGIAAPRDGFGQLSALQLIAVHAALNADWLGQARGYAGFSVEGFTGLDIAYGGSGVGDAQIRLANTLDVGAPGNTAYSLYPSTRQEGGDGWFEKAGSDPVAGNYDWLTILHELGHTLGLRHPHEAPFGLPAAKDSLETTVMTYRSFAGDDLGGWNADEWDHPQTYMMYDIAALQALYGADFTTRAGNTVYRWDPENGRTIVDGAVAIEPGADRVFLTIWDGGGRDTYDFSSYATDLSIDLAPGGHSLLDRAQLADLGGGPNGGLARGNVFNALLHERDPRSLIEGAIGGSGDDRISGNAAANQLCGGDGADMLIGLGGRDRLKGGSGADTLAGGAAGDFLKGGAGADTLIGGFGDDRFVFLAAAESPPGAADRVVAGDGAPAFEGAGRPGGDRIDLHWLDADAALPGRQAAVFGGNGPGSLQLSDADDDTLVRLDTDGDGAFDLEIRIEDAALAASAYAAADFIL